VVYRPQPRRGRPLNGQQRRNGKIRRLAITRVRARERPRPRSNLVMLVPLAILAVIGTFVGAGVLSVFGGTAAAMSVVDNVEAQLPDVTSFEDLDYALPSVIYDRSGTVELARFQTERRRKITFDEIPPLILDATIATEDRTFWENEGYDPAAILSAGLEYIIGTRERGASTITQQFVRARLLPEDAFEGDVWSRKLKEILQARRLTQAYPGEAGKQRIITAYLNQIYYGHNAYGVAAAAEVYFGISDMSQLTIAQAALLAGLPQAPDTYDLFRWAEPDAEGRLVVPITSTSDRAVPQPVVRRNFILHALAEGYGRWTTLTDAQLAAALAEPIVLAEERPFVFKAPHFVWTLKSELDSLLAQANREPLERGGYRIVTSLDWEAQQIAEKYVTAATIYTQQSRDELEQTIEERGLGQDRDWLLSLRGKDIHNGALVALDARTGDILAYVGSAGYDRDDLASEQFKPKFDVAGLGYRQPGSAWKPIEYAAGFDQKLLTPGTLLLDTTTEFARGWLPRDADRHERGPVLLRQALTYSLNIPAIRGLERVGVATVGEYAERLGISFFGGPQRLTQANLASAIGTVETNLVQLTSAFGTLANGGARVEPRDVLEIRDSNGELIYQALPPTAEQVFSPEAAWLTSDVLKDSTDPSANLIFGPRLQLDNGPDGGRRVAAAKTGTTDDLRDLSAYGYLAPPADTDAPQVVVGVWMGNSDHSAPQGGDVSLLAADAPGRVWQSFLRDYTDGWPLADFDRPDGVVEATIDAWSGGKPGSWTRDRVDEWFIKGTQPGAKDQIDPAGLLYVEMCDGWFVDITKVEPDAPPRWQAANAGWMARARRGAGVRGDAGSDTAYLFGRDDWGGTLAPLACPTPEPTPEPSPSPSPDESATPNPNESPAPTPDKTPGPKPKPKPKPSPEPTPTS
jgi:membrane peptidoglycan carboxypeptidase